MGDKGPPDPSCIEVCKCNDELPNIESLSSTSCADSKSFYRLVPSSCTPGPSAQEVTISHLQQNRQELYDASHNCYVSTLNSSPHHANPNNSACVVEYIEKDSSSLVSIETANVKSTDCSSHSSCAESAVQNTAVMSECVQKPKLHQKAQRVPSTPILIVSDTSTGKNNCVLLSSVLSNEYFHENKEKSKNKAAILDNDQPCIDKAEGNMSSATTSDSNSSPIVALPVDNHEYLGARRSCDSAYDSCMDTVVTTSQEENTMCLLMDNEIVLDNAGSETAAFSSADDSPHHHLNYGSSLSVDFPSKRSSSVFSSNSSIASDSITDASGGGEDSANLQADKESMYFRKLSSSSNFSLRSSLSFEESEEDFASGDDAAMQANRQRRHSKIKAQNSWSKLRRMVIWSPFMQSYKKKYPWVQLAGHAGNFQPGDEGCILKKFVQRESDCLKGLTADPTLRDFAPTFHGIVNHAEEKYTRMQDLLLPFDSPSLMDCKMGIRTYLEDELIKAKVKPRLRHDMYQKMIEISPDEPTPQERKQRAVTKPRYMQWREQVSSTSNLGFRIEGIKKTNKDPSKDFKLTKTAEQVTIAFKYFIANNILVLEKYIKRLKQMKAALEISDFFNSHETIGSSLLFVHDSSGLANIWMIDFGKTSRLPDDQKVDHRKEWVEGNREDGYLFGMDNMILIFQNILKDLCPESSSTEKTLCSEFNSSSEELRPTSETPVTCIGVTATRPPPSPNKRQAIKRQLAQSNSNDDDYTIPHIDITTYDINDDDLNKRTS